MNPVSRKEIDIPAIRERELRQVLEAWNLQKAVDEGSALCVCCRGDVGWAEIAGLIVREGGLEIVCNRPGCIEEAAGSVHD